MCASAFSVDSNKQGTYIENYIPWQQASTKHCVHRISAIHHQKNLFLLIRNFNLNATRYILASNTYEFPEIPWESGKIGIGEQNLKNAYSK